MVTLRSRTAKKVGVGLLAVSVWPVGVAVNILAANASEGSFVANVAPDTSSPIALLDGSAYREAIWNNFQNVVSGCMESKGFTYKPAPPPPASTLGSVDPIVPSGSTNEASFGVASTQTYTMAKLTASAAGFAASNAKPYYFALRGVTISSTSDKYVAKLDFRAYDGVAIQSIPYGSTAAETGGCEAEGRRLVSEPALSALLDAQERAASIFFLMATSEPMVDAADNWSACMSANGAGTFESPDEPEMYLQQKAAAILEAGTSSSPEWQELKNEEIEIATATAECLESSGVNSEIRAITADEWADFALQNYNILMLAGGRTLAEGGR